MPLSYPQIRELLRGQRLPTAFADLDAIDRNAAKVAGQIRPRGTPLRIASKSIRVVEILKRLLSAHPDVFRGVMCYAVEEAAHLAHHGLGDLLVAYPAFQRSDLDLAAGLAADGADLSLVCDSQQGVERIASTARQRGVELGLVVCVDMSLELAGGRVHLGVRRSPLRTADDVVALARHIAGLDGVRFRGIMGYEAQVAGLPDASPFQPLLNPVKRWVKRASVTELSARRAAIVAALERADLRPSLVNGGGTGSLDTTTPDSGVTEVTAGSAFFKPHLFDYYQSPHVQALEPACFFALEVTRFPAPSMVTCAGGGYVASGTPGADKVPLPWLPSGLTLLKDEMCGEVQTPLELPPGTSLDLGDPVVFRHAKAGELSERFNEILLVQGGELVGRAPTYRGEGRCFL